MSIADATEIDVNKEDTSQEVMHSPSPSLVFFISFANSLVLFTWWMVLPTRSLRLLPSSLATICVTTLCLAQWALWGCLSYVFLVAHKI